jgi:hypothetical protein
MTGSLRSNVSTMSPSDWYFCCSIGYPIRRRPKRRCAGDPLTREYQPPDFRKRGGAAFHGRRIRAAGPVRVLVDLDALFVGLPEHHRAEPSVADGQRVLPLLRRMGVPKQRGGIERCRCRGLEIQRSGVGKARQRCHHRQRQTDCGNAQRAHRSGKPGEAFTRSACSR